MSARQSDCETEIVPSLHSKPDEVSATRAGFDAATGGLGAGFSATGRSDKAQLVQKSRVSRAEAVRIALHPEDMPAATTADFVRCRPSSRRFRKTSIQRGSLIRICPDPHRAYTGGPPDLDRNSGPAQIVDQQLAYQPSGNGMMSQTRSLSLATSRDWSNARAWSGRSSYGSGATGARTASRSRSEFGSLLPAS